MRDPRYNHVAFHGNNDEVQTPVLDDLATRALVIDRYYAYRYCSPTRRSLLTGRFPTSITTVQPDGEGLCADFLPLVAAGAESRLVASADRMFRICRDRSFSEGRPRRPRRR